MTLVVCSKGLALSELFTFPTQKLRITLPHFKVFSFFNFLDLNIKAVITAAKGRKINYCTNQIPSYLYLEIEDHETFQI